MILPDDVLEHIRGYAKPRIRFYREYKETLDALGLEDWPEVREKLCTPDAEMVVVALLDYRFAYVEVEAVRRLYTQTQHPFQHRFYRIELSKLIFVRDRFYAQLKRMIDSIR